MKIEYDFKLTESARVAAVSAGMKSLEFKAEDGVPHPQKGDHVSFGAESPVFEVLGRLFNWLTPQHLVVSLVLGPMNLDSR